ncbi:MAG: hypothetical protein ACRDL8_19605, partial [Solirubrobacteraceae bacterium]
GLRWDWILTATLGRTVTQVSSFGFTAGDWGFTNDAAPNQPWSYQGQYGADAGTTPTGWLVDDPISGDPAFTESITGSANPYDGTSGGVGYLGCSNQGSSSVQYGNNCHYGFKENNCTSYDSKGNPTQRSCWTYYYPESATLRLSMSARADNPIGIDFSGSATGSIVVNSDAPVQIGDQIINPQGSLTINAVGAITAGSGGLIESNSVSLSTGGAGAIGTIGSPLAVTITSLAASPGTPGSLSARAGADGVFLAIGGDVALGTVSASDGVGGYGDVIVTSTGSLLAGSTATANVTGSNITLIAADDAGTTAAPLLLAAHTTVLADGAAGNGIVNVVAGGQIGLVQTAGDLMIGQTVCGG